jgi:hypothetical protein
LYIDLFLGLIQSVPKEVNDVDVEKRIFSFDLLHPLAYLLHHVDLDLRAYYMIVRNFRGRAKLCIVAQELLVHEALQDSESQSAYFGNALLEKFPTKVWKQTIKCQEIDSPAFLRNYQVHLIHPSIDEVVEGQAFLN